ncbi:MAG: hypothetical protein A2Y57_03315 [Candidatus Woykebacteria bacterium RBG_13_40_7b]|uniref:Reverse transcriptase domain-containing protein n=1 Tax=Candidatus Woykebacteria bacterium RBG_13_40_7b TaxID=1802594 RepID=A0A1G1WA53_9BACT|nr:MAG: hypothetical protein A2Y57_03315 [Candidatus Woykebacteria bacterium RBG_13_40_7b]
MKTFSHLYNKIISLENLFQAWSEFKKGKRNKLDVGCFERHLEDNIFELYQDLVSKTYKHSSYTGFYIHDPKVRHIHKAVVRDRIVHHALFKILNPIFEPTFVSDSFSCREGYGTHKAFEKLVRYSRKVSRNYTKTCWALKCDIRKFFDSVDHGVLLGIIEEKVKDHNLIWLIREIISSYQSNCQYTSILVIGSDRVGIPIGNLTSQLFANVYLKELDQFVKHELKVKYHLRYADDFILLHQDKNTLFQSIDKLKFFLVNRLKLSLHPSKISLRKLAWGIDFVGYVALPYHQVLRTKLKQRVFRKIAEKINSYKCGQIDLISCDQSIQSYFGVLKHADTYKLEQTLKNYVSLIFLDKFSYLMK